jgi:hypothetical protein
MSLNACTATSSLAYSLTAPSAATWNSWLPALDTTSSVPSGRQPSPIGVPGMSATSVAVPSRPTRPTLLRVRSENHTAPSCQRIPSTYPNPDASVVSFPVVMGRTITANIRAFNN